jgi:hypothetical protein
MLRCVNRSRHLGIALVGLSLAATLLAVAAGEAGGSTHPRTTVGATTVIHETVVRNAGRDVLPLVLAAIALAIAVGIAVYVLVIRHAAVTSNPLRLTRQEERS